MKLRKQLFYPLILIVALFSPLNVQAQVDNRPKSIEGNRVIISEQEVPQIVSGEAPSSFNKNKVKYILLALGLLAVAGFAGVKLMGSSAKPKEKK